MRSLTCALLFVMQWSNTSRLDSLSAFGANYPEDYLPYATTRRNFKPRAAEQQTTQLSYMIWDSNPIIEDYQPAPSVHSLSYPASVCTLNHLAAHSCHSLAASDTSSCSSDSYRRRCCSLGCCITSIIGAAIVLALLSVIGASVYLGVLTNLQKSSLLPISGKFKVESGDAFSENLMNLTGAEFLAKASKYEAVVSVNCL